MILALLLAVSADLDLPPGTNPATVALFRAVVTDDVAAAKKAVARKGVELDARTLHEADTPLMLAANLGDAALVQVLLKAGAGPNVAPHTRYHHGPLFYAVMGSKLSVKPEKSLGEINAVVKALLDAKADPNLEMSEAEFMPQTTPLLISARLAPETLALMLEGGGDPNAAQSDGKSALALAVADDHEASALNKLDLLLSAGAKLPSDDKKRAGLLATALDHGHSPVVRKLLAAGCTVAPSSEVAPWLVAGAAATGDTTLFDELSKGVDCKTRFKTKGLVPAALQGGKDADAAKRERVLALAKRLAACGAPLDGALAVTAQTGDADAFAWADPLEPGIPAAQPGKHSALQWAALGGNEVIVGKLLARGAWPDGSEPPPVVLAAKASQARALAVLWPKAATAAREQALTAAADAACASELDEARLAETFSTLAKLGVEQAPDKVRGCSSAAWLSFHQTRRELDVARGGTREVDALVFGGDPVSAAKWETAALTLVEKSAMWWVPLGPFPRRVRSDGVTGMNPGFDVVLLGLCDPSQSASRLEALKGFYPGIYVKRVSAKAEDTGCPLVLEQPLVTATKSAKVAGETVTVSMLRKGRARACLATRVSAAGELSGFATQDLGLEHRSCADFEEQVEVSAAGGECAVKCGGDRQRYRVRPKGVFKLEK